MRSGSDSGRLRGGSRPSTLTHVELEGEPEWAQSHVVSGVKHLPLTYAMR